jgi:recombination protein RecA
MAAKSKKDEGKEGKSNLENVIAQITKQFGEGSIMTLGAEEQLNRKIPSISTGAFTLNLALGVGGVPRGRVVEIYGPESSGKTTLMLHIVANAQKAGGACAFIDTEHALDPAYAGRIGVDLESLLVSQPDSGEEALNICEALVKSGELDVVVVDSVAALAPKAELDGEMGQSHVGLQARLMSQALRKLTASISKSKTCVIFTNQIREKVGVMFGSPETTPGGRALKFYASVRLDIRRIATIKDAAGAAVGSRAKVKVVKNKVAAPFMEAEFDILYSGGISWEGSIIDSAIEHNLVEKRGSWLSLDGKQLGQGRDAARDLLKGDLAMQQELMDKIYAKLEADKAAKK